MLDIITRILIGEKYALATTCETPLYDVTHMNTFKRLLSNLEITFPLAGSYYSDNPVERNPSIVADRLLNTYPIMMEYLKAFDGMVYLCGGAVLSLLSNENPKDYDIFITARTVDEAEKIVEDSCKWFSQKSAITVIYARNVVTLCFQDTNLQVQFIRRLYKEPSQILLGFDIWASKVGYSPSRGFFATAGGMFAIVTDIIPLDLSRASVSFAGRIDKYIKRKRFKLGLISLNENFQQNFTSGSLVFTPLGDRYTIHINHRIEIANSDYELLANNLKIAIFHSLDNFKVYLPIKDYLDRSNKFILTENEVNVSFFCETYNNRLIPQKYIDEARDKFFRLAELPKKSMLIKLFEPAELVNFMEKYMFDTTSARKIWFERYKLLVRDVTSKLGKLTNPRDWWIVDNPGSQTYGQFYPGHTTPTDWYPEGAAVPIRFGITNERYAAIISITRKFHLPADVRKYLLNRCFLYELKSSIFRI